MKALTSLFVVLIASVVLLAGTMDVAEAKRLGGGASFGGKFGHSQSLKKNSAQRQASPALKQNAARKQQLTQRGGLMGMFGALALGGLLGAMFFGGAFEGINFMDMLIFGLIIFMFFKFMARRAQAASAYGQAIDMNPYQQSQPSADEVGRHTDETYIDDLRGSAPSEFDQVAFIEGARNCFVRLQKSWDEGDLADIRQFTTDHVFGEIQDQFHSRDNHGQTEIVSLDAELLSASSLGGKQEAIVLFRGELIEDGQQHMVEEVWHFVKPAKSQQPTWFLDGIQQVEG